LVTTAPPRLRELRPNIPAKVDNLVHRMLGTDPTERPATAREVADALRLSLLETQRSERSHQPPLVEPALSTRLGSSASRLVTSIVAIGTASSSGRDRALDQLRQRGADAV